MARSEVNDEIPDICPKCGKEYNDAIEFNYSVYIAHLLEHILVELMESNGKGKDVVPKPDWPR